MLRDGPGGAAAAGIAAVRGAADGGVGRAAVEGDVSGAVDRGDGTDGVAGFVPAADDTGLFRAGRAVGAVVTGWVGRSCSGDVFEGAGGGSNGRASFGCSVTAEIDAGGRVAGVAAADAVAAGDCGGSDVVVGVAPGLAGREAGEVGGADDFGNSLRPFEAVGVTGTGR